MSGENREDNLTIYSDLAATDYVRIVKGGASGRMLHSVHSSAVETQLGLTNQQLKVAEVTGAYSIAVSDGMVVCDTGSQSFTVTLPSLATAYSSSTQKGMQVIIFKDSASNTLTVAPNGSDTIMGGGSDAHTNLGAYIYAATATDWKQIQ